MKRNYIFLLIVLFIPVFVKADMSAPLIRPFEAVITDSNGIEVECGIDKYKKYNKGDVLRIEGNDNYYSVTVDNESCSIDKKYNNSFKPLAEAVGPNDSGVSKLEKEAIFYTAFDDVKVLKGPAQAYESVGSLKKGDIVTSYYYIEPDAPAIEYYYIEKDNVKGWINVSTRRDDKTEFWAKNNENMQVIFKETTNIDGYTFKINSIYNVVYWSNSDLRKDAVIEVDNKFYCLPDNKYYLFSEDNNVKYNFKTFKATITLKSSIKMYSTIEYKEEIDTIPANTKIQSLNLVSLYYDSEDNYKENFYVSYNGKKGWIEVNKDLVISDIQENRETTTTTTTKTTNNSEYINNEDYDDDDDDEFYLIESLIIFIIIAVSISILAFAAIIIINKKKKKKEETKEVGLVSNTITGDSIESNVEFVEVETKKEDNNLDKEGKKNEENNKDSNN